MQQFSSHSNTTNETTTGVERHEAECDVWNCPNTATAFNTDLVMFTCDVHPNGEPPKEPGVEVQQ